MRRTLAKIGLAAVAAGNLLLFGPGAFAQGCALCYTDAAATGPQAQAALRHGILVLMIPPMLIFAGLITFLYRRRNANVESLHSEAVSDPHLSTEILLPLH